MALTNAGRDLMVSGITGTAVTAFSAANTRLGVGDSTTAFSAAHTDLQAATNKFRKLCDSANVTGGNVLTVIATFATGEANFAWQEWAVFNASSAGTMLNRKVESLGTKTSAQTWVLTATLTFAAA